MKLWIRSQDKTELLQCSFFKVCKNRQDIWMILSTNATPLGTYSTKERCLEIIDEIQDALCGNVWKYKGTGFVDKVTIEPLGENVVSVINKEIIEIPNHDTFVYEMPEK